jgi:hypothetical protein
MTQQKDQNVFQLSLFQPPNGRQANYSALFDLAPRYTARPERKKDSFFLDSVTREFSFNEELYTVTITPARIRDAAGVERDEFPGEREALVEDVIRKMASDSMLGEQDQVLTNFSVYAVCAELKRHNHTFNNREVKEALAILHRTVIEIAKVPTGDRKAKPVVSASVFPTLALRDDSDPKALTYVTLNPFLAQAIKTLAFERVDYEWMMQIKGQLARWVFKRVSLMLANGDPVPELMEISASEIASNFGSQWTRKRDLLAHVGKVIDHLVEVKMISEYRATDVKSGRVKDDVIYTVRFSERFLRDRAAAAKAASFVSAKAKEKTGTHKPDKWVPITRMEHHQIRLDFEKAELGTATVQH